MTVRARIRRWRSAVAGFAAMLLFAAPAAAQDRARLILDWIPDGAYASFYAGVAQGIYRQAGIELTIERGFGSADTVTKVASNVAQFGIADIAAVMAGRVRAQTPVRAIAAIYTRPPHSIFVLEGSGITSFKDLEGRSLAGAPGSAVRVFLPLVMRNAGVDMSRVRLINSEPATMGPLQIYGNALIATEATIAGSPDLVQRFVAATIRALEFGRDNPDQAITAMMAVVPGLNRVGDRGALDVHNFLTFDSDVARRLPIGAFDRAQLARTWEAVAEAQGMDVRAVDPTVFVTAGALR
jgi:NitT/TauT family transport system substrate-binding protein